MAALFGRINISANTYLIALFVLLVISMHTYGTYMYLYTMQNHIVVAKNIYDEAIKFY